MSDKIRGELLSFSVRGADFWGTGSVRTKHDGGVVAVVGKLLGAKVGDTVEITGDVAEHPRYGAQFRIKSCEVVLPSDVSGVVGWLASKLPQISRRRAEALVERFGVDELWKLLDAGDGAALCVVDGITEARAAEIVSAYRASKGDRDRMVRLKTYQLTDNQIAKLIKVWGDDVEKKLQENPYAVQDEVDGFGWQRADQLARAMGLPLTAPPRLRAGLKHAMQEAVQKGHCFVASGKLIALAANKVLVVDEQLVRVALKQMVERGELVVFEQRVYLTNLAEAESRLAKCFATRARGAGRAA